MRDGQGNPCSQRDVMVMTEAKQDSLSYYLLRAAGAGRDKKNQSFPKSISENCNAKGLVQDLNSGQLFHIDDNNRNAKHIRATRRKPRIYSCKN